MRFFSGPQGSPKRSPLAQAPPAHQRWPGTPLPPPNAPNPNPPSGAQAGSINKEYDRFRSFAERYVIERAGTFEPGKEREQGWMAIQDAKTIYNMIAETSAQGDRKENI